MAVHAPSRLYEASDARAARSSAWGHAPERSPGTESSNDSPSTAVSSEGSAASDSFRRSHEILTGDFSSIETMSASAPSRTRPEASDWKRLDIGFVKARWRNSSSTSRPASGSPLRPRSSTEKPSAPRRRSGWRMRSDAVMPRQRTRRTGDATSTSFPSLALRTLPASANVAVLRRCGTVKVHTPSAESDSAKSSMRLTESVSDPSESVTVSTGLSTSESDAGAPPTVSRAETTAFASAPATSDSGGTNTSSVRPKLSAR